MTTLVGREAQLEQLRGFVSDLGGGRAHVALVAGEAGVGKSRLITEAAEEWRTAGIQVLVGNCLSMRTTGTPYEALVTALQDGPPKLVADALDALTGAVELPHVRQLAILAETVTALARRDPTLLVVEDLHWADDGTRDALLHLLVSVRTGRWGVVATYRPDDVRAQPGLRDLLERLGRTPGTERIGLDALDRRHVEELVAQLTDTPPAPRATDDLHRRSNGLPLLVEELVASDARGGGPVPPHLRDMFLARVDTLSDAAAEVVRLVAVDGHPCTQELLAGTGADHDGDLTAALEEAVTDGCLVVSGDGYQPRHELLREAVVDDLVPGRRRELLGRLARALEGEGATGVGRLAHHWYEAGELDRAGPYALEAASAAEVVHAQTAVHDWLELVLRTWDHLTAATSEAVGGRAGLLDRTAEAAFLAGRFGRAAQLADQALALSSDGDRPERLERLARYRWGAGDGTVAEATYRQATEELPDDATPSTRVRVLSGHAWMLGISRRGEEAHLLAHQALAAAEQSGDPLDRCRALLAEAASHSAPEEIVPTAEAAHDLATELDVADEQFRAKVLLVPSLQALGQDDESLAIAREGADLARERTVDHGYRLWFRACEARLLLDHGRWDEAATCLDDVHLLADDSLPAQFLRAQQARLAAGRGDGDAIDAAVTAVMEAGQGMPQQPSFRIVALLGRAEHLLWNHRPDDARTTLGDARRLASGPEWTEQRIDTEALAARAAADLADAARRDGRPGDVDELAAGVEDTLRQVDAEDAPPGERERVEAQVRLAHAELSRLRGDADRTVWDAVITTFDSLDDRYAAAYARWRLTEVLLRDRGGRGAARELLQQAAAVADDLGALPLGRSVRATAARARLRMGDEDEPDGTDDAAREVGLTAREHEVLQLVAVGRTNAEVGAALHISPRTVGVHVSRILRKLGAASRTEAADLARRQGVLDG